MESIRLALAVIPRIASMKLFKDNCAIYWVRDTLSALRRELEILQVKGMG